MEPRALARRLHCAASFVDARPAPVAVAEKSPAAHCQNARIPPDPETGRLIYSLGAIAGEGAPSKRGSRCQARRGGRERPGGEQTIGSTLARSNGASR